MGEAKRRREAGKLNVSDAPMDYQLGYEKGSDSDRLFFERFPERNHRVRRPFPGEMECMGHDAPKIGARLPPVEESEHRLLMIYQVRPGCRIRLVFPCPKNIGAEDCGEERAKMVFAILATDEILEKIAVMDKIMSEHGK